MGEKHKLNVMSKMLEVDDASNKLLAQRIEFKDAIHKANCQLLCDSSKC